MNGSVLRERPLRVKRAIEKSKLEKKARTVNENKINKKGYTPPRQKKNSKNVEAYRRRKGLADENKGRAQKRQFKKKMIKK